MKKLKQYCRETALLLGILVLLYSCQVYNKQPGSIEDAVNSRDRVKLVLPDGDSYQLLRLKKEDSLLLALTRIASKTGKRFLDRKIREGSKSKQFWFVLPEEMIKELYLRNENASHLVTGVVLGLAGAVVLIILIAQFSRELEESIEDFFEPFTPPSN